MSLTLLKKKLRAFEEADYENPIIFISPDHKPDVRLMVFKQEFHVRSHILKKGSNYFRKFLDSPDKQNKPASESDLFRYDYSTVVDEDGTWGLVTVTKTPPLLTEEMISRTNDIKGEIEGFRQLICAMYSSPYTIKDVEELSTLTRIADFYCALPIVSVTLPSALLDSPIFSKREVEDITACTKNQLAEDCNFMIFIAQKLRNSVLFRECLIHIAANWKDADNFKFHRARNDETIRCVIKLEFSQLEEMIIRLKHALWVAAIVTKLLPGAPELTRVLAAAEKDYISFEREPKKAVTFWKNLSAKLAHVVRDGDFLKSKVGSLLANNLVLDRTNDGPGEGCYKHCFLCTEIADSEFPWDTTAVDL
ncbi:uncharacterized protein Bfra_005831 [Botrytis fragariae]|uniref:BTB domain-containing protein n=1 Tax=Botrytis fragariae TaxID=1964551 RepID=A0A8H6ARI9_9HELO|nr:uncharacterized protein Bfra_005831 [Botrytis fragariae]KAF5872471.1 hypothetical protein Bfra_005831 [Botrytis fragariae]